MQTSFRTVPARTRHEIDKIKGSRFIATVGRIQSEDDFEALLDEVRRDFPDARHHCFAYRLGAAGTRFRSNDDGEPSGSAGRPILLQIDAKELSDAAVIVTRYFGGTKLGVGGLMRAYGAAAAAGLDQAGAVTVTITSRLAIEFPYACSGAVEALLSAYDLKLSAAEYGETVKAIVIIRCDKSEAFRNEFVEGTAGRGTIDLASAD